MTWLTKTNLMMTAGFIAAPLLFTSCASTSVNSPNENVSLTSKPLTLSFLSRYSSGEFGVSAAEIPAFDANSQRLFVVNAEKGAVDVLDFSDAKTPKYQTTISGLDIADGAVINSIDIHNGLLAVAIESENKTDNGYVAVYDTTSLIMLDAVRVGAQPDMVTFTHDGDYILAANEGEPSDDYQVDPEGSISIIDVRNPSFLTVRTAGFNQYNAKRAELVKNGVRIFGPNASVAQDLEPEYITVSADNKTAWVSLQENNALAKVDIENAWVTTVYPLGFKDHSRNGFGMDVSDDDGGVNITPWAGVVGTYHPDAIASFEQGGKTYIVTANEGDARAWGEDNPAYWGSESESDADYGGDASKGFVEEIRVKHLVHPSGFDRRLGDDMPPQLRAMAKGAFLNPEVFAYCGATEADPGACREDEQLGRLNVSWVNGYRVDANGRAVMFNDQGQQDANGEYLMYDKLYAYGARSMSIWAEADSGLLELVWDSGDMIEQFIAGESCKAGSNRDIPCVDFFNSNHDEGDAFESRSDNKGPEPEGVTVAQLGNQTLAFLGLERMGGVMVFDVTAPTSPVLVDYLNTREDWSLDPEDNLAAVGDLGPEGIIVIPATDSPNGKPLVVVGNEVSGTTSVFQVNLSAE